MSGWTLVNGSHGKVTSSFASEMVKGHRTVEPAAMEALHLVSGWGCLCGGVE